MTRFEPIVNNPDLDIHHDPPSLWSRVAIICRWKDAHTFRKRWPNAAIVGPLRTLRGLDELIRNLLHNPQVRVIILDGNDLTPGEETTAALLAVWRGERVRETDGSWPDSWEKYVAEDLRPHLWDLVVGVKMLQIPEWDTSGHGAEGNVKANVADVDCDRPAGRIALPPLPPRAEAPAPHGDPGERVAADTLAELWPLVLHRAMRFGRVVPTQYGDTRELMDLVAVIRDPGRLEDAAGIVTWSCPEHDWRETADQHSMHSSCPVCGGYVMDEDPQPNFMGLTYEKAEAYHQRVTSPTVPEGAPYSYGSRMRSDPDQFECLDQLLSDEPDTRAAFVTPWKPDEDAGLSGGRPCLVGAWFRVTDDGDSGEP